MNYTCILPVYNEAPRVGGVLKAVTQIKEISEIICVDGGSTDESIKVIERDFPTVTLIKHKTKEGKAKAVTSGLRAAKEQAIILLDSDMLGVKPEELVRAIKVFEERQLDCLILSKSPMNAVDALQRKLWGALLLSQAGERIIKKRYLEEALESSGANGYQLEIAQNKYLIDKNKNTAFMDISARNVGKAKKLGLWAGVIKEISMWKQVIDYAGLPFLIKQSFFFTKQKVS